jgi:hypothetical protein
MTIQALGTPSVAASMTYSGPSTLPSISTPLGMGSGSPVWYIGWPLAILITLGYLRFGVRAAGEADVAIVTPGA